MAPAHDTRERLLAAAAELFYARGYEAVGVQELCAQAGARKGSFYHWYASKQALALAVLDRAWGLLKREALEPAFRADVPVLERFDRFTATLAQLQEGAQHAHGQALGCRAGGLGHEMSTRDALIRDRVAEVLAGIAGYFAAAIHDGVASGELPAVDPQRKADAVLAQMEGVLLLAKVRNDPGEVRELGPAVRSLLAR